MYTDIVNLCIKRGFLRTVCLSNKNLEFLRLGPVGMLLKHNLFSEWYHNVVINKDVSVFMAEDDGFNDSLAYAKQACMEQLPFGIAQIIPLNSEQAAQYYTQKLDLDPKSVNFDHMFTHSDKMTLKCTVFMQPSQSLQFFHQWQKQRRIWWRKFSPNPGRYCLTEIKSSDKGQSVEIAVKYPWGSQIVEKLVLLTKVSEKFKDGRKLVNCSTITSQVDLATMCLNTMCDAFDNSPYKGYERTLMRFHRKISPYGVSFAITSSGVPILSELSDLALYLTKQLRANHISTLLLPTSSKLNLEAQWNQYDELGVPFCVVLNEKTLKDGMVNLRSRETTLKEQVHVSELVNYVDLLFKNY